MTHINRIQSVLLVVAMILASFALIAPHAHAMPRTVCQDTTASATSTVVAMTPGTGTTTLTTSRCFDRAFALDTLSLAYQYTAVATAPTLKFRIEGSFDGIDWYPEQLITTYYSALPGPTATTSIATTPFHEYTLTLSTTTDNGGSGTSARVHGVIPLPTFAPYERVKFYVPTGGGNGSLWASLVGTREIGSR